ncbi:MAG: cytochrome C oxidase subunit IV [Candidatus Rokuibacteriota bacterium]|nr:MAG: cytochrome C oxidase subunit IV [Candidatus Rokubacteria bacterium]
MNTSDPGHREHASVATYIKVALVLTALTGIEVGAIYIRALTPILIPTLLVLSLAKFSLVVLFFMHLRYDTRTLSFIFVGPLLIALAVFLAVIALIGAGVARA